MAGEGECISDGKSKGKSGRPFSTLDRSPLCLCALIHGGSKRKIKGGGIIASPQAAIRQAMCVVKKSMLVAPPMGGKI